MVVTNEIKILNPQHSTLLQFLLFAFQQEIPDVPLNPNELKDPEERTGWRKYISIKKD